MTTVAPANQTAWSAVTSARLVGPSRATCPPAAKPSDCRTAATSMASLWSCAHGTWSFAAPFTKVIAPERRAAASMRETSVSGVSGVCTGAQTGWASGTLRPGDVEATCRRRRAPAPPDARRAAPSAAASVASHERGRPVHRARGRRAPSPAAAPGTDQPRHRYTAELARDLEVGLAGPLGRRGDLRRAEPGRRAERRVRGRRRSTAPVRHGHVPLSLRGRAPRRASARLHRHRRVLPLQADVRHERPLHAGLRRLRPARRAARHRHRHPPPREHRDEHREHAAPAAPPRPQPRPPPQRRHHRRGLLPLDAVDLPADLQRLVRRRGGPGPTDRRARGRAGGRGRGRCRVGARGRSSARPSAGTSSTATASPTSPTRP